MQYTLLHPSVFSIGALQLDCVSLQVSQKAIVFPVQCAAEGCAHPFIWQDFLNIFKSTKFKLRELKSESLKAYLKANKDKVRNCPTPDCEMVYAITEDGKRFICSSCGSANLHKMS